MTNVGRLPAPQTEDRNAGLTKAATLLITLGEETSAELLRNFNPDEAAQLSREVARLSRVTPAEAEAVLDEFMQVRLAHTYVLQGGLDYAKKLLNAAFGPDTASRLITYVSMSLRTDLADFEALSKVHPQQLAKFIMSEHPQTVAVILAHLRAARAAELLVSLPAEMRVDVTRRMATLDQISQDTIAKVTDVLRSKLASLGEVSSDTCGGVRAVAEICNRLDETASRDVLQGIQTNHPELADAIRNLMFVFSDLLALDASVIQQALVKIDKKVLTVALKGAGDELRKHLLSGMSQRAAEMIGEDIEALGPTRLKDIETAQHEILAVFRKLEADGVISLKAGEREQYVA